MHSYLFAWVQIGLRKVLWVELLPKKLANVAFKKFSEGL